MDAKTEEFTRLHESSTIFDAAKFFPDGKQLVLYNFEDYAYLADMEGAEIQVSKYMSGSPTDKVMIPNVSVGDAKVGMIGNHFVGSIKMSNMRGWHWGRIALDGKSEFEPLPLPKNISKEDVMWLKCLATAEGKGLLLHTFHGGRVVLLRFEK
jgi:hypothetical protein